MPLTNYGEAQALGTLFGNSGIQPTTGQAWNVGLIAVTGIWTASTAYTVGQLVIPTNFATGSGQPENRIFRCTTAGTTGSTQPGTWTNGSAGAGSTMTDGGVTWTEVTGYFYTYSNITAYEPSTSSTGYARLAATNSQTGSTWASPTQASSYPGSGSTTFQAALSFGPSTASWGIIAGFFLIPSAGSPSGPYAWNTLSNYVPMLTSGMTLTLPASSGLTVTLT